MRNLYFTMNGAAPTTAAITPVVTGATIKTMLQITSSTRQLRIVEWGISFNASAAAVPINCELVETGTAGATVVAHVAAGVQPYSDPNLPTSNLTLGTTSTGYTASGEGTVTVTKYADLQLIAPTNQYIKQWPLGQEFVVAAGRILRVRVTAPATVGCLTYLIWNEQ